LTEELVVGTVIAVTEHPGARAPSLLLTVDLGPHGMQEVVLSTRTYDASELEGTQIVCRRDPHGVIVVGAHSHGKGIVLVRPGQTVENGTVIS
jgi:hypothetical protein